MGVTAVLLDTKAITFVDSPQFIRVTDDGNVGVAAGNFYIDIKVWTGLKASIPTPDTYKLFLPAIPLSGIITEVSFEISKFIKEFIVNAYIPTGGVEYNGTNGVWYNYEVSADNGNPVVTSVTKFALNGYGYHEDGTNPGTTIPAENGKVFCEQSTKLVYADNKDYIIPVFIGDTSTNYEFRLDGNPLELDGDFGYDTNSTDSAKQIAYVNIGLSVSGLWSDGYIGNYVIDNSTQTSSKETYTILVYCTRGVQMSLKYLNSCGSISELPVNGREELSIGVKRTNYRNSPLDSDMTYDTNNHMDKTFGVNGTRFIDVTTGWVYEESNNMITDLMVSKLVWLEYGATTYPVQIRDTNKKIFNRTWDSQVGYDFKLEVATPLINQVL